MKVTSVSFLPLRTNNHLAVSVEWSGREWGGGTPERQQS